MKKYLKTIHKKQNEVWDMLAIPILIIVFIVAIILRFGFGINETHDDISPSLTTEEIQDLVLPDEELIALYLSSQFTAESVSGDQVTMIARDGEQAFGYMSKGTTTQPDAIVILIHDLPSSTRSAKELDSLLGTKIAQQFNAVTVSVDWRDGVFGEDDVSDVLAAIAWADEFNSEIRPVDVYMIGIGHGGYLATRALEETETEIESAFVINGYYYPLREYTRLQAIDENRAAQFLVESGCDGYVYPNACLNELGILHSSSTATITETSSTGVTTEDIIHDTWSDITDWLPLEQKVIAENPTLGDITQ